MSSKADLRNVSGNFGAKILNNLNSVKNNLQTTLLHLNFIRVKFKEILVERL